MKRAFVGFALAMVLMTASSAQAAEDKGFFGFMKKKDEATSAAPVVSKAAPAVSKAAASTPAAPAPAPATDMKAQNLTALVNRMANNNTMTDAIKTGLAAAMLKHFSPEADVRAPDYEKDVLYFEQVSNDPNMKPEEKKALIEKYELGAVPAKTEAKAEVESVITPEVSAPVKAETPAAKPHVAVKAETTKAVSAVVKAEAPVAEPQTAPKVEEPKIVNEEVKVEVKETAKEEKPVKKASNNFSNNFSKKG